MHPERHGESDPRRQSSLPSSLHALIIGPQQQSQDEPLKPSSSSGEPREGWDEGSRAFRPIPSFPDPGYTVGNLAPAAFDEESSRVGNLSRRRPPEPLGGRADDSRRLQPTAAQLPPLQSILPGGASPPEQRPPSHGSSRVVYSQPLPLPLSEPTRPLSVRPYWQEQQAGPSSQSQYTPPPRHGYSYPMPQVQEPAVPYSHLPPPLPPISSSFPPPRYGGYHESGGEYPAASTSLHPYPPFQESYTFPPPAASLSYEAGRGRILEARSEYGSPTLGHLRRHLDPDSGGLQDDPRRGRSLPPRRPVGASGSRPVPSRLSEPEERGPYPPSYGQPLPHLLEPPAGVERPGDPERRLSPVEFRTRPGSRRSITPQDRPPISSGAERQPLHSTSYHAN